MLRFKIVPYITRRSIVNNPETTASPWFIGYHLRGPHADERCALVREIAEEFGLPLGKGYFPTHVTLKAPFFATPEQGNELRQVLETFSQKNKQPKKELLFRVNGFGHLGREIIALDIVHSVGVDRLAKSLIEELRTIPWMTWRSHEPLFHFHITLARKELSEKFDKVWAYLQNRRDTPHFEMTLDSLSIFTIKDDHFVVGSTYSLVAD